MRRGLLAASLLLAAPAWALFGNVTVNVRDAKTGRPLDHAFVFARETGEIGRFHGSTSVCIRADVKPVVRGRARLEMPLPSPNPMIGRRKMETIAYRPGYCATQGSGDYPLELQPAVQTPHERLMHLEELALSLSCPGGRWGNDSDAAVAQLEEAVDRELKSLETDAFGRKMATQVRQRLRYARTMPPGAPPLPPGLPPVTMNEPTYTRDLIFAPANRKITGDAPREMAIMAVPTPQPQVVSIDAPRGNRPGNAVGIVGGSFGSQPVGPPLAPLAIHCRHGALAACDVDERSETGETPLGETVRGLNEEHVKLLLAAGADPSVPTVPGGPNALERLVERMLAVVPQSREADSVKNILQQLVAHPKASIPRRLKDDLARDPKQWEVRHWPGVALLAQSREALAALPAHANAEIGCYSLGASAWHSRRMHVRLWLEPAPRPPAPPIRPDLARPSSERAQLP